MIDKPGIFAGGSGGESQAKKSHSVATLSMRRVLLTSEA